MARKQKKEVVEKDAFIVLMTALSIILLAFFIVMNAIAIVDETKSRKAIGSLIGSFGILPGGLRMENTKGTSITPSSIPLVEPKDELSIILKALAAFSHDEESGGSLGIYGTQKGLVIVIGEKLAFESGSVEIRKEVIPVLKKIAEILLRLKKNIFIEGHTDNIPIATKRFRSNWELSTARAVNTLRFLVEQCGIPGERVAAVGYGASHPLVPNDTPEHRNMNRRVEIIIAKEKDGTIAY